MKSLTDLWQIVLAETSTRCCISTTQDLKKVLSRVKHEGLSFLTITLPSFGSAIQKSLDQEYVDRRDFQAFAFKSGLPLFLGGFLDHVFDRGTGRLLDYPCIDCISSLRQLTLMFGKILLPCSDERESRAMRQYIECEKDVKANDKIISDESRKAFHRMSLLLFGDEFDRLNRDIEYGLLTPKHGPGSTADKLSGNAKFDQREWTSRLESVFPYGDNCLPNWRFHYRLDRVEFLEPGKERPVRVVSVPKTLKTPRIIAIEPTCMQYMQQAIAERMVDYLEHSDVRDMIGFTDQIPNQEMARKGSFSRDLATLDLSEASDRVSNQLVRCLVQSFPSLGDGIDCTRSRKADVPGHGVIRLAKFASMGSALCFPVEACVFLTLAFLGIQESLNRQLTRKDIQSFRGKVRVYGDDIIVPTRHAHSVILSLEDFGLRVNKDKSFWTGKFRESCGKEYYDGHDVSIAKVRRVLPTSRQDVSEVISAVAFRNIAYERGLWHTAYWIDARIQPILRHYPFVRPGSPILGRYSFLGYDYQKISSTRHSPMVKGWTVRSRIPDSEISGEGALVKWFLKRGDEPFADRRHLERSGRPDAVGIKLGWAQPY